MIRNKKELREYLLYELKHYENVKFEFLEITEFQIIKKFLKLLRKTEFYINTNKKIRAFLYKIRLKRMQNKYALQIPINVFDKGLRIMHVGPILVNGNAKVGKDCVLHMNTAIVAGGRDNRAPILKDNIVLGVGAVILGGVIIESNNVIGANAVVNKSFEEKNIAIAGVPAKKISNNGKCSWNKDN